MSECGVKRRDRRVFFALCVSVCVLVSFFAPSLSSCAVHTFEHDLRTSLRVSGFYASCHVRAHEIADAQPCTSIHAAHRISREQPYCVATAFVAVCYFGFWSINVCFLYNCFSDIFPPKQEKSSFAGFCIRDKRGS